MTRMLPVQVRILLVEDSEGDAFLVKNWLEEPAGKYEVHEATDIASALDILGRHVFHAVILDLSLPDTSGLEGIGVIHNMAPAVPIVVMTGHDDEMLALKAVERGAQDYLIKGKVNGEMMERAMRYAIQRKLFEGSVIQQANFDRLTGLVNRALFESRLNMALGRVARSEQGVAVLFLDLNAFKEVNDKFGHQSGDNVLREVGARIARCIRPYDTAARLGGDEFAVLIEGIEHARGSVTIATKLIDSVCVPMTMGDYTFRVGLSIGIETCSFTKALSSETLMWHADEAMYCAKREKGSSYCFYTDDMEATQHERERMKTDLRKAVDQCELMLCYQPKQCLSTDKICGAEALVRWNHSERGIIPPAEFIPVAEDINMIENIEKWVLATVCDDIRRWREKNLPLVPVSVNVSARLFEAPCFIEFMETLLHTRQIAARQLSLELPESLFLLPDKARMEIFSRLYDAGVGITMDQFSVQKSSLQSLKAMVLDEVKFGSRFMENAEDNGKDMMMVRAVISCAHSLGLKVIACGVESSALRDNLKAEQCDSVQGFVFSHPIPVSYLEKWLQNNDNILPDNEIIREQRQYSMG